MQSRLIIGDDHPLVQAALREPLKNAFPSLDIDGYSSLGAVMSAVAERPHDVALVILDLNMPDAYGMAGLFMLQSEFPTIPVVIMSGIEDSATVQKALKFGASGYIPKSLALPSMVEALTTVMEGEVWCPPDLPQLSKDDDDIDHVAERLSLLSTQQLRILTLIAEGRLNKQIAGDLGISEQTVKGHVSAILKKLGVVSRTHAAVIASKLRHF